MMASRAEQDGTRTQIVSGIAAQSEAVPAMERMHRRLNSTGRGAAVGGCGGCYARLGQAPGATGLLGPRVEWRPAVIPQGSISRHAAKSWTPELLQ
jgi:hypothetical protein